VSDEAHTSSSRAPGTPPPPSPSPEPLPAWCAQYNFTQELYNDLCKPESVMLEEAHIESALALIGLQHVVVGGGQALWVGAWAGQGVTNYQPVTHVPSLQIHHVGTKRHYLLSFVYMADDDVPQVCVLDTALPQLTPTTRAQLAALYENHAVDGVISVRMLKAQCQGSTYDCGLFAIAYALEVCFHFGEEGSSDKSALERIEEMEEVAFDQASMKAHLRKCFEEGELQQFPNTTKRVDRQPSSVVRVRVQEAQVLFNSGDED
jgi:hypothetical protein